LHAQAQMGPGGAAQFRQTLALETLRAPDREDIARASGSTAQEIGQSRGQGSTIGIDVSPERFWFVVTEDSREQKSESGGTVGIEIASLTSKSFRENGIAPLPLSNWSLLEPSRSLRESWAATSGLPALGQP